jgi:uncharacterized membrane protein
MLVSLHTPDYAMPLMYWQTLSDQLRQSISPIKRESLPFASTTPQQEQEMVTAAKTVSQVGTHMGIAFSLMYFLTGSPAFGGLAAVLEPLINVVLLPVHERVWHGMHQRYAHARMASLAAEKLSQTLMHMAVAFSVMYFATGSLAFGGVAAVLEPIINVVLLPIHDGWWDRLKARLERGSSAMAVAGSGREQVAAAGV